MVTDIIVGVSIGWCLYSLVRATPWFFSKKDILFGGLNLPGRILLWITVPLWLPIGIVGVLYDKMRGR